MIKCDEKKCKELIAKYNDLIEECKKGNITQDKINEMGKNMFFADNETFQLMIPNVGNTPEHGEFFINSIKGHYCYSYSDTSTHTYHILEGNGIFIIDGKEMPVKPGDTITIEPPKEYTYIGRMILVEEMEPNFVAEYEHEVRKVDYDSMNIKAEGISK